MNKKELVESVSIERNLTKKEAELLVDTVFNTITRSVVEGDKVLISGFGTFKVNDRKARKGISPKTQEEKNMQRALIRHVIKVSVRLML